jgi:hypothetical protein
MMNDQRVIGAGEVHMIDNELGGRRMHDDEGQIKKPVAGKKGAKRKASGKLRLINGGAAERTEPRHSERQKPLKGLKRSKRLTREEREEKTNRAVNRRFVNAGACFGLIAFLGSYLLPEYKTHAPLIGLCAGALVYIGLHIVNFVKYYRQVAYKLGFLILSTLLVAALIYTFFSFLRG